VASFPTSSFSAANALPVRVLQLRARLAQGEAAAVLGEVKGAADPDLQAVAALAEYLKDPAPAGESAAVDKAKALAEAQPDNLSVQLCCGTVLARAGLEEEALALLSKHQGSLDA
jgi:coatomer subunit epsilon